MGGSSPSPVLQSGPPYTHTRTHAHTHTRTHMESRTHMRPRSHTRTDTRTYTHTHARTRTSMHTHAATLAHSHTQAKRAPGRARLLLTHARGRCCLPEHPGPPGPYPCGLCPRGWSTCRRTHSIAPAHPLSLPYTLRAPVCNTCSETCAPHGMQLSLHHGIPYRHHYNPSTLGRTDTRTHGHTRHTDTRPTPWQ